MKTLFRLAVLFFAGAIGIASAAPAGGFEGLWTAEQANSDGGAPKEVSLDFTRVRGALAGVMRAGADELPLFDVREAGTNITFTVVLPGAPYIAVRYAGVRTGDEIRMVSTEDGHGVFTLTARRGDPAPPMQTSSAPTPPPLPVQTQTASLPPSPALRPALPAAPPAPAPAAAALRLDGNWTALQASPGSAAPVEATLVFSGDRGTMHVGADDWPLFDVAETGANVAFTLVIPGTPYVTIRYSGTLDGDELQLASRDDNQGVFRLNARRAGTGNPPPIAATRPAPAQQTEPPRVASLNPPLAPPVAPPVAAAPAGPPGKPALPPLRELAPNNLAKTPPMGWASRQRLGTGIDDAAIRQAAEGLDQTGLRAAGYVHVEVGDGWQGPRDRNGALHGNEKFPDMKALGDTIHGKGLKFGLTLAAGEKSCGGFTGSYGHEEQDAKTLASWGVDYVVYEWCGAETIYTTEAEQRAATQKMAEALRATGRDIVFGMSQEGAFDVARWGAKSGANLWRTGRAIEDDWQAVTQAGFGQNGKEEFAAPGRWNDPGLVQVGNGGMTPDEYRSQVNLWAILAAPLMLGTEVRIMTRDTLSVLINEEAIAIDQDPLGRQGKRVAENGETEVWARPLADGSTAVAFFNRGAQSAPVAVSWQQLGIEGARRVRDLWWHQNLGVANGRYVVFLTGHTSLLLRLSP